MSENNDDSFAPCLVEYGIDNSVSLEPNSFVLVAVDDVSQPHIFADSGTYLSRMNQLPCIHNR